MMAMVRFSYFCVHILKTVWAAMKQLFQLFRVKAVEAKLIGTGFPYETLVYLINHITYY